MAARRLASINGLRYIYIIECQGRFKIGLASDPSSRLAALQTATPFALSLRSACPCYGSRAFLVEASAHKALGAFHMSGEWFACSFEQAQAAIQGALTRHGVPHMTVAELGERLGGMHLKAMAGASPVARAQAKERVAEMLAVTRRV